MYKLMIVDDEVRIVEGLEKLIDYEALGISRIETATNYEDAVKLAIDFQPDIALLDVCIHDKKGFDIIDYLDDFNLPTKYIIVSGYDDFSYAKEGMLHGARDYLLKPVEKAELTRTLKRVIVEDLHGEAPSEDDKKLDPVLKKEYESFSNLTKKIIVMVQQEYGSNISLKILGDKFKMNSTYLGQLFLKDTGLKFSEYLMNYRLYVAKHLIETTDDKIAVIAESVGYSNLNYFYTQFQQMYNASPTAFRRE